MKLPQLYNNLTITVPVTAEELAKCVNLGYSVGRKTASTALRNRIQKVFNRELVNQAVSLIRENLPPTAEPVLAADLPTTTADQILMVFMPLLFELQEANKDGQLVLVDDSASGQILGEVIIVNKADITMLQGAPVDGFDDVGNLIIYENIGVNNFNPETIQRFQIVGA